jgi:hypothetical protein
MNNITEERIVTSYATLHATIEAQAVADEQVLDAKADLALKCTALTVAGQIVGKNDTERDACKRNLLAGEYAAVNAAERTQRVARVQRELAELALDQLKLELRTAELRSRTADYLVLREPAYELGR